MMNYVATQIVAYYVYIKGGGSNVITPVSHGNLRYRFVKALIKSQCEGFRENADELAPPENHSNIRGKAAFA